MESNSGSLVGSRSSKRGVIRVLVADADPVARFGLKAILTQERDITVLAAETGAEVDTFVANHHWDVIVLDPSLAGHDGPNSLELLRDIKRKHSKLPVLVLSGDAKESVALRALRAGVAGYISKRATPKELVGAVRQLAEGRRYMNRATAEELLDVLGRCSSDCPTGSTRSCVFSGAARVSGRSLTTCGGASGRSARIGPGSSKN